MRISDWSSDVCSSDLVHKDDAAAMARLRAAFEAPSLYDELLKLLARRGFDIPADRLERDWTQPYEPSEAVEKAWLAIYTDVERHWHLYTLAEKITALEDRKSTRLNSSH